jgi:hypothetical protein
MEEWPTSSETTIIYLQNEGKKSHRKMMYKTTFAEPQQYNRLGVTYQLSSMKQETGMLLPGSERKKKKSCNKNAIKHTEMLEKYIYCIPISINISPIIIAF